MTRSFPGACPHASVIVLAFAAFVRQGMRYTPHTGRRTRATAHRRDPPPPSHELIRPLDGESPGLEAAPTEHNALPATRRLIARIKCEACDGVREAAAARVLNADDAQILEEDTEVQRESDLVLFRRWHRRRGTDPETALEELRRRTGGHARKVAEEHECARWSPPGAREHPGLDNK